MLYIIKPKEYKDSFISQRDDSDNTILGPTAKIFSSEQKAQEFYDKYLKGSKFDSLFHLQILPIFIPQAE